MKPEETLYCESNDCRDCEFRKMCDEERIKLILSIDDDKEESKYV
jgi:hypothetical protein